MFRRFFKNSVSAEKREFCCISAWPQSSFNGQKECQSALQMTRWCSLPLYLVYACYVSVCIYIYVCKRRRVSVHVYIYTLGRIYRWGRDDARVVVDRYASGAASHFLSLSPTSFHSQPSPNKDAPSVWMSPRSSLMLHIRWKDCRELVPPPRSLVLLYVYIYIRACWPALITRET